MKQRKELLAGIEEGLLALILRANRARIYEDLLRGGGVDMDKALYPVLSATAAIGPARVSEIADLIGLNPTTVSRHLASLEEMGLVGRSPSDLDGRAAMVDLTEIGKRAVSDLRKARRRLFAELLDDFEDEDLERFESYLGRLFEGFEASIATGARA
jgi:DNA-binding MarR family transcriptional regulator